MRIVMPLVIFFMLSNFASAQTNFRFADSTAQWNVVVQDSSDFMTNIYIVATDTLLNGANYQVIRKLGSSFTTFFRQDSSGRVFQKNYAYYDTSEVLVYDFSKTVGDTVKHLIFADGIAMDAVIDSVDSVYIGKWRKQMFVTYLQSGVYPHYYYSLD